MNVCRIRNLHKNVRICNRIENILAFVSENFKKSRPKKLVKSNESISRSFILNIFPGTVTQDDILDITEKLQEDSRFKALDRLDADRKLMLFQVIYSGL